MIDVQHIRPGDKVIVTVPENLDLATVDALEAELLAELEDVKVIVVVGASVAVYRKGSDSPQEGWRDDAG